MKVQHFADWLEGMMGPLGILAVIAIALVATLYLVAKGREWKLARERAGFGEATFVRQLSDKGIDPAIASLVYVYLRDEQKVPFPMMPEDSLDERLGVAGHDLEQTIDSCLRRAGRAGRPGLTVVPPGTLGELVRYVQESPLRDADSPSGASGVLPMQREDIGASSTGVRASSGAVRKATTLK